MIDISSVKAPNNKKVGRFWLLVVDEATDMKWSYFLRNKSQQVPLLHGFIKNLKEMNKPVKFIRCDNAGENYSTQQLCDDNSLNIKFEFTGPGSPQYNGRVERKFATLYGKVRSLLNTAQLPEFLRKKLWAEACNFATDMENLLITPPLSKSPYELFYGHPSPATQNLHQFGEVAVVERHEIREIRGKLENRGKPGLYLGRVYSHTPDVYRFYSV